MLTFSNTELCGGTSELSAMLETRFHHSVCEQGLALLLVSEVARVVAI